MKSRFGAVVAAAAVAALLAAGCDAGTESTVNPPHNQQDGQRSTPETPDRQQWRLLEQGSLVGVIQKTFVATSWDRDEYLFSEELTARGYEVEVRPEIGQFEWIPKAINEWVDNGAAAIVLETTEWDKLAEDIARARAAGVRMISYLKPPPPSIEIDAHIGLQPGTYEREQLELLTDLLVERQVPKPWRIASISHAEPPAELGEIPYQQKGMQSVVDDLIVDGILDAPEDIELVPYEVSNYDTDESGRTWFKRFKQWLRKQTGLDAALFSESGSYGRILTEGTLLDGIPVVGGDISLEYGPGYHAVAALHGNSQRCLVLVPLSNQVKAVGDVLDAFRDGTEGSLARFEREGVPVDLPSAAPEFVTLTQDNYKEIEERFPDDLINVQYIFDEWVTEQ